MRRSQTTASCQTTTYKCELCKDTGWIQVEIAPGYTGVKECSCVKARKAEAAIRRSGLADVMNEQTFDAFVTETPMQKKIKEKAIAYRDAILQSTESGKRPWFYIGGNPGSGKTHICTAICGDLLQSNIEVVYMQWLREARRLKTFINDPDFDESVYKYTDCSVLYIDDLFKQSYGSRPDITEADIKLAFTILNDRYLQNKATIISSEWSLIKQLIPTDEGVFSRVYERCKEYTLNIPRNPENNYRMKRFKSLETDAM